MYCLVSSQLSISEILQAAVDLAENGFPVAPITAHLWNKGSPGITLHKRHWYCCYGNVCTDLKASNNVYGRDLLLNDKAPQAGEVMTMPLLAETLKVSTALLRHLLLVLLTFSQ